MRSIAHLSIAALVCAAMIAEAAAADRTSERGVTVVRGAKIALLDAAVTAPAPRAACRITTVAVTTIWPARRFRQQGFWSGDGLATASMRAANRRTTYGFYADRVAAGR
ncbi:MAG: hypothetical protein ACKVS5_11680 [Parvularculaceae bacterium]